MSRCLQAFTILASGVIATACGDSRDTTPTSPQLQVGSGPACTPANIKKYAKALAGTNSPIYTLAQQFTSQNANKPAATNLFFDLAAETADLARPGTLTSTQKTNLSNLLIQGIACANVVISDADYSGLDYVDEFTAAAGATGGLEVRGRTATENDPIYSHNIGAHGSTGVKAPAEGFDDWYGGRVMFYGFPISGFSNEAAPLANRIAFEWFTIRPAGTFLSTTLRGQVGVCVVFTSGQLDPTQLRVQHSATILPVGTFAVPCNDPPLSPFRVGAIAPGTRIGGALAWLSQRLLPQPLQAANLVITRTPSGSPKSLSPIEAVNPLGATLTYDPAPTTGAVNEGIGAKVHATGDALTDWEGLLIKIIAQDNNGRFVAVSPDTATTNGSGIADFSASTINKPGVYKLVAVTLPGTDGDATGFVQDSVITVDNFHRLPN